MPADFVLDLRRRLQDRQFQLFLGKSPSQQQAREVGASVVLQVGARRGGPAWRLQAVGVVAVEFVMDVGQPAAADEQQRLGNPIEVKEIIVFAQKGLL